MKRKEFEQIQQWVYRNARSMDLSLWQYFFENGSKEKVITEMMRYQNEDGGFGHAFEPDCWNPESTPYNALVAARWLTAIGWDDFSHPITQGLLRYLASGKDCVQDYWRFNVPGNNAYPRAPWMNYNEELNQTENVGVTAELTAFIIRVGDQSGELYQKALRVTKRLMDTLMTMENLGDMGVGGFIALTEAMVDAGLEGYDYDAVFARMNACVTNAIEHDSEKWKFYGGRPSFYITSPDSRYYQANQEIVQKELDYLEETRPENDVWPITWTWFDNMQYYAKEFAVSENWWKTIKAIEQLNYLRAFGRLTLD